MAINPYVLYPSNTDAPDAYYPYGSARNVTVPGDGTGTPWEEDVINDIWGFFQHILGEASQTPSGNPDQVGASQYYGALQRTAGFPGLITPLALQGDPAAVNLKILILDGSGILAANYSDLVSMTYCGNGDNPTADAFYRADDAAGTSRNTSGAYFILPDMRGRFVRGLDTTGTIDPDGATRLLGDEQLDAVQKHNHLICQPSGPSPRYMAANLTHENTGSSHGFERKSAAADATTYADDVYIGEDITPLGGAVVGVGRVDTDETRSRNVAFTWGIWY